MAAILNRVPELDYSSLTGKPCGKLRLTPEQLLAAIHAQELADWSLHMAYRFQSPRLARGSGGRPAIYRDKSILLMAVVQTVWRKSYEQIVDYVATHQELAVVLGFEGRTISQGQYWERREALGILPFLFFFLTLVAQLIRLGVIRGQELIVDSSLLSAWLSEDPGVTRQKYAGKKSVFGYKVHTVLCHQTDLPLFALVTPAHVHDSQVGWFVILVAALLFGLKVLVVYVDAAYFDKRMFWVVHEVLGAHPAIHYNLRKAGKKKLATLDFLDQWQRLVTAPRTAIERHFAWMKRYFGLKYFQCFTLVRVMQFIQLTYIAALAVALSAERYQCPDLHRRRSSVLAHL
jgi:Transposase DDE domain